MGLPSYEKRGLLSDCMTPLPVHCLTAPQRFVFPLLHIMHFPQKACTAGINMVEKLSIAPAAAQTCIGDACRRVHKHVHVQVPGSKG